MDDEVIGFGLQVRDNGRRTFTLDYTFEGRCQSYFINDYPAWSVMALVILLDLSSFPLM